jgi:hypothetical protein
MATTPITNWTGDWITSTDTNYDYMSNMHVDSGSTSFTTTVTTGDESKQLQFNWRISSEGGYDFIRLFVDGTELFNRSGADQGFGAYDLTPNASHTIVFQYTKDGSGASGTDTAYIGAVVLADAKQATALVNDYSRVFTVTQATPRGWTGLTNDNYRFRQIDNNYQSPTLGIVDAKKLINGFLTGTTVIGANPLPWTKVNLYDRRTGILVRSTRSDVDGKFRFLDLIPQNGIYYVIAVDPDNMPLYNSILFDHIAPVPYDISLSGQFVVNTTTGTMTQGANIDSGMPPFTATLVDGSLPPGLTIQVSDDQRHVIAAGTTTFFQDYYFTIKVQNGQGYAAQQSYTALLPTSFGKGFSQEGGTFNVVFYSITDLYYQHIKSMMLLNDATDKVAPTRVWSTAGATTFSSDQSKFGATSLYVPNDSNNPGGLSTPYSRSMDVTTANDWTIESYAYLIQVPGSGENKIIFTQAYNSTGNIIALGVGNENNTSRDPASVWIGYYIYPEGDWHRLFSTVPLPTGRWVHVAATKKAQVYSLFFDGELVGRGTMGNPGASRTDQPFYIGRRWANDNSSINFNGYLNAFRITKGQVRYSKNFTPPTEYETSNNELFDEFFSNVGSSLDFENGLVDRNFTWTAEGTATILNDPTAAKVGLNSGLFDGDLTSSFMITGDLCPIQNVSDSFTIDLWFYHDGVISNQYGDALFGQTWAGPGGDQGVVLNPDGSIVLTRGVHFSDPYEFISAPGVYQNNVYNHYALTFDGITMRQFLNGTKISETPTPYGWNQTTEPFRIGSHRVTPYPQYYRAFKGNIDNFRITMGVARWTDNFNPPSTVPTKYSDDPNGHIRRFDFQPLNNGGVFNNMAIRHYQGQMTYDAVNKYMLFTNDGGDNAFLSFDDWGDFTGNYFFEIEVDFVQDSPNRFHWGFFLPHGPTGYSGYRITHLDAGQVGSTWDSNQPLEFNSTGTIFPQGVPVSVGNRYTIRVEVVGNVMTMFINGIYAIRYTDSTWTGLRPGLHSYGCRLGVRRVTTGTLTSPLSQDIFTPLTNYNVAFGRRAWLQDPSQYFYDPSFNPAGYWEVVDGVQSLSYYITGKGNGAQVSMIVDLEQPTNINQITIWHWWGDGRTYINNKTEVSVDGSIWTTIYDANIQGSYSEVSTGHVISFATQPVRYIRDGANGSDLNDGTHWTGVEASLQ